jgi:beta-glucanase (GH16 family)
MSSTLHWGPSYQHDAYIQTHGKSYLRRQDFTTGFHTFGLEWTENYIFMYLDSRLKQVHYTKFKESNPLWKKGGFSSMTTENGTFDQKFYLILNVAVGAQNGWFWDGKGAKPWVDDSEFAARDFWKGK